MASLKFREKKILEEFLEMGSGFVLNFVDRTFAEFFLDFGIDIDNSRYLSGSSGSKANRMRSFWALTPDQLVGDVLLELVAYSEGYRPGHPGAAACRAIAARLQALPPSPPESIPTPECTPLRRSTTGSFGRPVEIFFSYAHEDWQLMDSVRRQLVVHERLGRIAKWHDRMIPAGDDWRNRIDDRIRCADVILLFMSPDFLASRYCYEVEGKIALQRLREGSARIIPVVLRPCDWVVTPFGTLQGLPTDGIPITQWPDRDQASLNVARGIMDSLSQLNSGGREVVD